MNEKSDDDRKVERLEKMLDTSEVYKKTFENEHGEAVLMDLARKLYFDSPTHKEGDQALDMARKEGMRQAYCIILRELGRDTLQAINLIHEIRNKVKPAQVDFVNTQDDILNGGM